MTHRPKLFPCCASQSLVPGSQYPVSSASGMSVILPQPLVSPESSFGSSPALLRGVTMIFSGDRHSSFSSQPTLLGQPAPCGEPGYGSEHITSLHKCLSLSSLAGLLWHHDLPLLHLCLFYPLGESSESRQGATLRKQEDAEYLSEVSGKIWTISSVWHSGSLEQVKALRG